MGKQKLFSFNFSHFSITFFPRFLFLVSQKITQKHIDVTQ